MKVLFLSPRMPHPGVLSGHMIVHQRISRLVERGYEVGLACFTRPGEEGLAAGWQGRLREIETVPDPSLAARPRRVSPWALWPFDRWRAPEMMRRVGDMVERTRYDVAIAEFSPMGMFFHRNPFLPAVRRVISCHQCATVASQKRCDLLGYSPAGVVERWRRDRLRRLEFTLYRSADRVLVLTPQERHQLLTFAPDLRTAVIPSGVDTAFFRPPEVPGRPDGLVFTGYYSDEPNRDAVRWFVSDVWPRIKQRHPELFFYIVGSAPPPDIRNLSWRDPRIVVTGEVPDVRPWFNKAVVFVCPVRMGSGMRGKLLEAMAYDLPVVTTSLGGEGIPVQPGGNCMIADRADLMADQVNLLLEDEALRRTIARRARALVIDRFSWNHSVDLLETVLAEATSRS